MRSDCDRWMVQISPACGFIRVRRDHADAGNDACTQFRLELQRVAINAGFSPIWTTQILGAVGELEDNIHWHSQDPGSGILAYWVADSTLEIVVLDRGTGVLRSLRQCDEFASLSDYGAALKMALQDEKTRCGSDSGRG